jgi:hypothetical protein
MLITIRLEMNERIKELKEQATRTAMWPGDPEAGELDAAKFAELIVRECADNIAGNIDLINPESSYNYGLRRAMNSVKEHFGVEE